MSSVIGRPYLRPSPGPAFGNVTWGPDRLQAVDRTEAQVILESELARLRLESYEDLASKFIDHPETRDRHGPSGTRYQIEVQAFWDDPHQPGANLRVTVSIDDGGLRALAPLSQDFIRAPDDSFI